MLNTNSNKLGPLAVVAAALIGFVVIALWTLQMPVAVSASAAAHAAAQATATQVVTGTITPSPIVTHTNACGILVSGEIITPTVNVTSTVIAEPPTATVTPTVIVSASKPATPTVSVLRIGEDTYPAVLDPQRASFVNEFEILSLAYEGLVKVDARGNVQPAAASKFEFTPDGKQLTFTLQPNLKRVDGTPITSQDFAAAIQRGLDPCLGGRAYASVLSDIQGAEALSQFDIDNSTPADLKQAMGQLGIKTPDANTLTIEFAEPVGSYWLQVASLPIFFPTDTKLSAAAPDDWASVAGNHNGNGPFVIINMDEGSEITLAANPNYRLGKPKLDRIEFHYDADNAAQLQAYKDGLLDIDAAVSAELVPQIMSDTLKSELQQYDSAQTYALAFNNSLKPFNDRIVRTAFSQAVDRAGFVKDQLGGVGEATTRWLPASVPGSQPDKPGVPGYDPQAAVKTLVDNGYGMSDGKVDCAKLGEIKFTYPDSPINAARVKYLSDNLQQVLGCPITPDAVSPMEFTLMTRDVNTNPQLSLQRWVEDYPHPQNWLSTYWTCGSFAKDYGYCSLFLDQLLKQADATPDFEQAAKLYGQAEDMLIKDVPGAFLYNPQNLHLVKPYVIGPVDNLSPRDAGWAGQWGPVNEYDIDLSQVPDSYPRQ